MTFTNRRLILLNPDLPKQIIPIQINKVMSYRFFGQSTIRTCNLNEVYICNNNKYFKFQPSPISTPLSQQQNSLLIAWMLQVDNLDNNVVNFTEIEDFPFSALAAASAGIPLPPFTPCQRYKYFLSFFINQVNDYQIPLFQPIRQWKIIYESTNQTEILALLKLLLQFKDCAHTVQIIAQNCIKRLYFAYKEIGNEAIDELCKQLNIGLDQKTIRKLLEITIFNFSEVFKDQFLCLYNAHLETFAFSSTTEETKLVAKQSRQKNLEYELSVQQGETLYQQDGDLYGWILCQNQYGEEGWVPDQLVQLLL